MPIKLGQLLLREKLVTAEQLEEALKSQAIFGGRLGSFLVEAGALREEQLAALLGRKYQVPFARSDHFSRLSPEAIKSVPRELAEKYLVLPLKKEGKRLWLAMADPGDLRAIEEIGFRIGCVVRPVVAAETVIIKNLQRYYGTERVGSYLLMDMPKPGVPEVVAAEPEESGSWLGSPDQDVFIGKWEIGHHAEPQEAEPSAPAAAEEPSAASGISLDELGHRLAEKSEREGMADLVAAYLAEEFVAAALLLVRKEKAIGWRGIADRKMVAGFEQLRIDLSQPSMLRTAADSKGVVIGTPTQQPGDRQLFQALGIDPPAYVLVAPVMLAGRLVGLICIDNRGADLSGRVKDLQRLADLLAAGLEILILKNKLAVL
jgi:hypothetical protein